MNPIITLTTDFGLKDSYVGALKGAIISVNRSARIIDISHNVSHRNIFEGSLYISQSYSFFPKGTIHVGVIDPGVGTERRAVIIETADYFFVGPDNGLFTHVLVHEKIKQIINITNKKYFLKRVSNTFHGRDIFAPVAAYLGMGIDPADLGVSVNDPCKIAKSLPVRSGNTIRGEVIYIDSFGNLITNITDKNIESLKTLSSGIEVSIKGRIIDGINLTYGTVEKGGLVALAGSSGYIEIACNCNSAAEILNVTAGEKVEVTSV